MSNLPATFNEFKSGPAAVFGGVAYDDDLGAAIQAGYSVIGYRGKTWSIKSKGEEIPILRNDGSGDPMNSIDVVIVRAPNHLSKVWYEVGWNEGSSAPPDCQSSNGLVPDPTSPKKQNDVCLTCKWNAFGSRPAVPGQTQQFKGKACGDNKRLAVVPLGDILNEQFGGPMLLRVPAASLADLEKIAATLKQLGFPYYAAGIKISFDTTVSYPKFVFKPLRPLNDVEGNIVLEHRVLDLTSKIIDGDMQSASPPEQKPPQQAAPQTQPADNVVHIQQPPPTQQVAEPVRATGFGGPVTQQPIEAAPASHAAPQKTASGAAFGGGGNGAATPPPAPHGSPAASETTGVAQFDTVLDKKLEGLL